MVLFYIRRGNKGIGAKKGTHIRIWKILETSPPNVELIRESHNFKFTVIRKQYSTHVFGMQSFGWKY